MIVDLTALDPVRCPCGWARRAMAGVAEFPGTLHLTEIDEDALPHRHETLTETYVILRCDDDAAMELDGTRHPVKPLTAILIRPGTVHRAIGKMQVLIICTPEFDPNDEQIQLP